MYSHTEGSLVYVGQYGDYWTSTPNGSASGYDLRFVNNSVYQSGEPYAIGFGVRCVRPE
jgi:hypothetical protein